MISLVQGIAKLSIVLVAITALRVAPALASSFVVYISSTGSDANPCTAAQPCASFVQAVGNVSPDGQILCLNSTSSQDSLTLSSPINLTIDCPGVFLLNANGFRIEAQSQVTIRNLTFNGLSLNVGIPAVQFSGSGTLILENCNFENTSLAISVVPSGPVNLVVKNTRLSNNTSGVLIKPAAGGSLTATFDHVTITNNTGGGIKLDTTNSGPITVDITDSEISNNGGNGLNAVGGAGGPAIFNISRSVIVNNGVAGIQANGIPATARIDTTLLESNLAGATSVVSGGHMLTYGTNRIVGPAGSGFTGSASLQ